VTLNHLPPGSYPDVSPPRWVAPTMRQLVHATILAIMTHPLIQDPPVYWPVGQREQVRIRYVRAYGGIELAEPGLTLSVYPHTSTVDVRRTLPTVPATNKSCVYESHTLGRPEDGTWQQMATYHLMVTLNYAEPSVPETYRVAYDRTLYPGGLGPYRVHPDAAHGYDVALQGTAQPAPADPQLSPPAHVEALEIPGLAVNPLDRVHNEPGVLAVDINLAEEVLREYMDLLRIVLADTPTLRPFAVRSTQVKWIDYVTSHWLRTGTDIYFHQAMLLWELTLYPPANWRDLYTLPPAEVYAQSNVAVVNPFTGTAQKQMRVDLYPNSSS
jgi:hypothetical protein